MARLPAAAPLGSTPKACWWPRIQLPSSHSAEFLDHGRPRGDRLRWWCPLPSCRPQPLCCPAAMCCWMAAIAPDQLLQLRRVPDAPSCSRQCPDQLQERTSARFSAGCSGRHFELVLTFHHAPHIGLCRKSPLSAQWCADQSPAWLVQAARLRKRVNCGSNSSFTVPTGPLRCLVTITSVMPRSGVSGL